MMITAIIVTYNSAAVIESALNCVYGHPAVAQCIVVDNASQDTTLDIISTTFPRTLIIRNNENVGFGRANNQGLEQTSSELALLMNPDAFIDSEGIDMLRRSFFAYPRAAIIAPLLEQHSMQAKTTWLTGGMRNGKIKKSGTGAVTASFISGAIAMWRMEYMKKVGFFDPAIFLFYEDDDISIRTVKAGYELMLMPDINVRHIPGCSCPLTDEVKSIKLRSTTWSRLYMIRKYRNKALAQFMARAIIGREQCRSLISSSTDSARMQRANEALRAHDEKWKETLKNLNENTALAVDRHTQEVAAAEKLQDKYWRDKEETLRKEWEGMAHRHGERVTDAKRELERQKELSLAPAKGGSPTKVKAGAEAFFQQHVSVALDKQWEQTTQGLEQEWAELVSEHEKHRENAIQKFEDQWRHTSAELEKKWTAIFREHEAQLASLSKTHEEGRAILLQEIEKFIPLINRRREIADKIWAAKYFLQSPERFLNHA